MPEFPFVSNFPILFIGQCATLMVIGAGELGVAGYTMFVRGLIAMDPDVSLDLLYRLGYFNVVCDACV